MAKLDFTAYMETLATSLKDVGHVPGDKKQKRFYRVSSLQALEELITGLTNINEINIVVEDNREGDFLETKGQYVQDDMLCSFLIIKRVKLLDMSERNQVLDDCEAVYRKILAKIRYDHLTDQAMETNTGLRDFDINSIHYFTFGPVLNNSFGLHCSFRVGQNADIKYNSEDWA